MKKDADDRAYLYRLLSARPCTEREAVDRLVGKGADRAEAEALAEEFREMGMIDDEMYARLFVEGHESWGNDRIRYELRRRGVRDETIASVMKEGNEIEKARPLIEGWMAQGLEWNKIAARLLRRGFSSGTVRRFESDDPDW